MAAALAFGNIPIAHPEDREHAGLAIRLEIEKLEKLRSGLWNQEPDDQTLSNS